MTAIKTPTGKSKTIETMDQLAETYRQFLVPFKAGDVVEVTVLAKSKNRILVDISGLTQGVIPEKEFSYISDEIENGDKILAYVVMPENESGLAILSLKMADSEKIWDTLAEKKKKNETIPVKIKNANRGGLIAEYRSAEGFIPVSQLASHHYPKVEGGNQSLILKKLQEFVGQFLDVKIISLNKGANKLIFSEKSATGNVDPEILKNFQIGQEVAVEISAIADFGLFVKAPYQDRTVDGLIHYTEISWNKEEDWRKKYKVGQKIKAGVISASDGRLALSIKILEPNPWEKIAAKYKVGDKIKATVSSITPFGAFIKVAENVEGLAPGDYKDALENDKKYNFEIIAFEPKQRKITLKLVKKSTGVKKSVGLK